MLRHSLLLLMLLVSPVFAQSESGRSDEMWPQFSPDGERIAYVSNADGNFNVYVMNSDGSGVVQLTDDPAWDSNISWSPDGEWIAFASLRSGNGDIYIVKADGSGLKQLTDTPEYEASPIWSPDGRRIVFMRRVEYGAERSFVPFVMNADGSDQRNLFAAFWDAQGEMVDGHGLWSPDGSQFAFSAFVQRGAGADCLNAGNVYVVDIETGTPVHVVQLGGGGYITLVRWYDDLITLAKRIDDTCSTELADGWYTLDLANRSLRAEAYRNAAHFYPSPDGEQVAFYSGEFNRIPLGLSIASRAFTDVRQMVVSPFYNGFGMDWSPDGRYVIGSMCTETDADLYLIDTETGDTLNLTADISDVPVAPPRECGLYG